MMETKTKVIGTLLIVAVFGMASAIAMYSDGKEIAEKGNFYIVSNTEYWSGEEGAVLARFTDFQGSPIAATNCSTDILYPDQTTFFVQDELLTQNAISGDWYYNFTVPGTEGVYDYAITCVYGTNNKEYTQSKTFHVSPALNKIKTLDDLNQTINGIVVDLDAINTTVNNVYDDTQYVRNNMILKADFDSNMTAVFNELNDIDAELNEVQAFCDNTETNSSSLCQLVHGIDSQIDANYDYLQNVINVNLLEINATTHNTYDYVTGTLATNVNTILTNLGIIQTGINQINSTVNTISSDVNTLQGSVNYMQGNVTTILTNQESEVDLNILS